VFGFNESLDEHVIKPVATACTEVVPGPVRQATSNFFGNIGDAWSAINLVPQGRFKSGLEQTMRFGLNSTSGLLGLIDITTEAGIDRRREDLGKTFGRWGFGNGPYLVWPLLGPSSVRDSFAMPLDRAANARTALQGRREQVDALRSADDRYTRQLPACWTTSGQHRAGQVHARPRYLSAVAKQLRRG